MPKAPRGPRSPRRTAAGMASLRGGVDARSEGAAPASTARATPTAAGIPPLASASQVSAAPQEGNVIEPRTQTGQAPRRETDEPSAAARFHIFIVDSGWNSPAHRVLVENFALIRNLQKDDPIYVLSLEQSIAFQRHHASRIGRDPIIAVHDMEALDKGETVGFHGFRLSLGLLRPPSRRSWGCRRSSASS